MDDDVLPDLIDETTGLCSEPTMSISPAGSPPIAANVGNFLRHRHGPSCGHTRISHGGHEGYLHNGHLHCIINGKFEEHELSVTNEQIDCNTVAFHLGSSEVDDHQVKERSLMNNGNTVATNAVPRKQSVSEDDHSDCHHHSDACGHERVLHHDHYDYLVDDLLHHAHNGHCDVHGKITRIKSLHVKEANINKNMNNLKEENELKGLLSDIEAPPTPLSGSSGMLKRRRDISALLLSDDDDGKMLGWRFIVMLCLTGSYMFVELGVGLYIGSLSLFADAIHMLSDLIALIIGFYAVRVSNRPRSGCNTYGFQRMEVVAGLINSVFLLSLCLTIFIDAIKRFFVHEEEEIKTLREKALFMCIVAAIGLGINIIGLVMFGHGHSHGDGEAEHGHSHSHGGSKKKQEKKQDDGDGHSHAHDGDHGHSHGGGEHGHSHSDHNHKDDGAGEHHKEEAKGNLNSRAVFLHVAGDALGSVGVIISGLLIYFIDSDYATLSDPLCSLFITLVICVGAWPITKESVLLLLHSLPPHLDTEKIRSFILNDIINPNPLFKQYFINIHDLHVWQITSRQSVASLHLSLYADTPNQLFMNLCDIIKIKLHSQGIHSSAIQPEFIPLHNRNAIIIINNNNNNISACLEPICQQRKNGEDKGNNNNNNNNGNNNNEVGEKDNAATKTCIRSSCCATEFKQKK